ncbi:LysR family transcriptional regulator substrate-binding protein [Corynebacterium halotolerans]|uniref:LysR substrate-binding domain-containing protein n=1 Tax=Corynebacterium halotolerans YIM 70093 = DSM 44683 TaxID=1121362 RepID=M1NR77_9CORY|nr:LysR family transcriptional regulator substrate-binding protein [Corynebacterium halotolerans]AGF72002.1 hypothetical protein A605_04980 [Corynebacterium halotolerans YIM 70093 = DSM 44683]
MLTLSFVTGTEPGKWFHRFRERTDHGGLVTIDSDDALAELLDGRADLALTRLPDARVTDDHHVVRLYGESPGVAVPRESVFAELGEDVAAADLADEHVNYRIAADGTVDVAEVRVGLQVVGANVGVVIAPRPLLKVLAKKQAVPLGLDDPGVPHTEIALVWHRDGDSEAIQDFVGIAKGRTVNSSRQAAPKRTAREKALAKQARRVDKGQRSGQRRSGGASGSGPRRKKSR